MKNGKNHAGCATSPELKRLIIKKDLNLNLEEIAIEEFGKIIKQFKNRKAPGPDEVPMEVFGQMYPL